MHIAVCIMAGTLMCQGDLQVEALLDRVNRHSPVVEFLADEFERLGYASWAHRVINTAGYSVIIRSAMDMIYSNETLILASCKLTLLLQDLVCPTDASACSWLQHCILMPAMSCSLRCVQLGSMSNGNLL